MGVYVTLRLAELGEGVVLAPERFDPRRQSLPASPRTLGDYAEVITDNVSGQSLDPGAAVLILDTTHAYDGFVIFRHEPVAARELGSAKRRLQPGDVIKKGQVVAVVDTTKAAVDIACRSSWERTWTSR